MRREFSVLFLTYGVVYQTLYHRAQSFSIRDHVICLSGRQSGNSDGGVGYSR